MSNILKLVLTDHWFEEIKSGRKTHEYRMATLFWYRRIDFFRDIPDFVEFQKAYRKNPERMTFKVKSITYKPTGLKTDLNCQNPVFDIKLGERVK
jgi:hypothetical protein|nr:MAG TPA: activating signal cointegrator [Caudoviricetes sp.]